MSNWPSQPNSSSQVHYGSQKDRLPSEGSGTPSDRQTSKDHSPLVTTTPFVSQNDSAKTNVKMTAKKRNNLQNQNLKTNKSLQIMEN